MQHTHRPRRFLAFPWGGTAPASRSLTHCWTVSACIWSVVNSLLSLLSDFTPRSPCYYRRKTPLQGSRFADFSTTHRQSSAGRQQPPRVIHTTQPATMANLFRRIYDWLLRLFWYAYLLPSHLRCAQAWMPDARFDTSTSSILIHGKSKVVYDNDPR
jgi:hypothetical protein